MKIYYPIIQGKSGTDIFTYNLAINLKNKNISSQIKTYPSFFGYYPPLLHGKNPYDCDIVHANSWNGYVFKKEKPLLVTEHTAIYDSSIKNYKTKGQKIYHQYIKKFERKTLDSADTIICVSSYCKKILENQFGIPCDKVIYNGVDPGFFKRNNDIVKNNKKITLFFSGNHTRMKGFDVVLEIATRLKNDVQIILSSGFKQNRIEKLSSNIISVGTLSRNEMVYYYNKSDIFLFPTRLEGCSLTVTEAMASEMPIIATNCASLPEQVDHGKGGMLCKMDDVDDFVKNIQYISEDEELRNQMGRYNRKKVLEIFTDSLMTENYISEYRRLVK